MELNLKSLREFARRGHAAQTAVNALIAAARKCPNCGGAFLPQTHNHKYCSYKCRHQRAAEFRQMRKQYDEAKSNQT